MGLDESARDPDGEPHEDKTNQQQDPPKWLRQG
jgi:hypothetical protein